MRLRLSIIKTLGPIKSDRAGVQPGSKAGTHEVLGLFKKKKKINTLSYKDSLSGSTNLRL